MSYDEFVIGFFIIFVIVIVIGIVTEFFFGED